MQVSMIVSIEKSLEASSLFNVSVTWEVLERLPTLVKIRAEKTLLADSRGCWKTRIIQPFSNKFGSNKQF